MTVACRGGVTSGARVTTPQARGVSIWWFAFGYFACYVPYAALTKALADGLVGFARVPSLALLPLSTLASMVGMMAFITGAGWWRYATLHTVAGVTVRGPGRWTFFSGLGTAAVVVTTTLAYTFGPSVSIVLMMLLLRGGVLVLAPIVDALSGRRVRFASWVALGLSLLSLVVTFTARASFALTTLALVDVAVYLAAYFVRLRLMSRLAKSDDPEASRRYFIEEQMVATPAVVVALVVFALVGPPAVSGPLRAGFFGLGHPALWALTALVGLFSQGTGIFGGLILLDRRENTFCVPVNRASSMLAGPVATLSLYAFVHAPPPASRELVAAGLLVLAIVALSAPEVLKVRGRVEARGAR